MMKDLALEEQLRLVKLNLRGVMNGVVSSSMREKGLNYRVNFGVDLPRLRSLAEEFPHTPELAIALWKEDIRECRLLAAMLYPAECFEADLAEVWIEQMRYAEEAECTVMHLFCRMKEASQKVFEWIAHEGPMFRLCGWLLLGRLVTMGFSLSDRDMDEVFDHMEPALKEENRHIVLAAQKTLVKLMELSEEAERRGEALLQ